MEKAKIKSIVLDYKSILDNIPTEYRTKELLSIIKETIHRTLEKLLPSKYFALYREGEMWEIVIFNSIKALHKWEDNTKHLINDWNGKNFNGDKISYSIITFTDFDRLADGKYSDLDCYRSGLDYNDPIAFSPFYA